MASWYQEMKAHLLVRGQLSIHSLQSWGAGKWGSRGPMAQ